MADSVGSTSVFISVVLTRLDRVFAHAVNTVKKIPRAAGSSRPPLADRLLVFYLVNNSNQSCMDCINRLQRVTFQGSFLVQESKKKKLFVQNGISFPFDVD